MKINIVNKSKYQLPAYSTVSAAGIDIRANIDEEIILKLMERALVKTGLYIEIPLGYEVQLRSGNGLDMR